MFEIELDLFSEFEHAKNPRFTCKDWNEFVEIMIFFFENGYDLLVRKKQ